MKYVKIIILFFPILLFADFSIVLKTTIASMNSQATGANIKIDVSSSGKVAVCYYDEPNTDLKYSEFDGANWTSLTIVSDGNVGQYNDFDFDSDNNPNFVYFDATNYALKYTGKLEPQWNVAKQSVIANNVDQHFAMNYSSDYNTMSISYYDKTTADLKYAEFDGTIWSSETITSEGNVGQYNDFDFDSDNDPNFVYYDATSSSLKYAGKLEQLWNIAQQTVIANNVDQHFSIEYSSNTNTIGLSYYDQTTADLKYAEFDGTIWTPQTIVEGGVVGQYNDFDFDADGYPNFVYYNLSTSALQYAGKLEEFWIVEKGVIESGSDVGKHCSIEISGNNNLGVSYFDATNGDLKYAEKVDGFWEVEVVDGESGYVGEYSDLAYSYSTIPIIAYYDASNSALKFTQSEEFPVIPENFVATPDKNKIRLSWDASTTSNIKSYLIYYRENLENDPLLLSEVFAPTTTFLHDSLKYQYYYYTICSKTTSDAVSSFSDEIISRPLFAGPVYYVSKSGSDNNKGSSDNPFYTIQKGIDVASSGDTLIIMPGTYKENFIVNNNLVIGSQYLINEDDIYIAQTIIDGNNNGSVVTIENEVNDSCRIAGLTIKNGNAANGGGVNIESSSPRIDHALMINNKSTNGGAIYCNGSNFSLLHSIIYDNSSTTNGGGLYISNNSSPVLKNSIFWNNTQNTNTNQIYIADNNVQPNFYNNDIEGGKSNITGSEFSSQYINNIDNNPEFVDASGNNFRVLATSPCIDAGLRIDELLDPDSTLPDIGIYYYPQYIAFDISTENTNSEKSGQIEIEYSVVGYTQNIGLKCQYKLKDDIQWKNATVIGDTSQVSRELHNGNIIWDSEKDIVNDATINAIFKVTSYSYSYIKGTSDSLILDIDNFHDENIVLGLSENKQEYSSDIAFDYQIYDKTNDIISFQPKFQIDSGEWKNATINIDPANLDSSKYEGSFQWNTIQDIGSAQEFPKVRFTLVPNDGWSDGIGDTINYFYVDNNLLPSIAVNEINNEVSNDIPITFQLSDPEQDSLNINIKYSIDDLIWNIATVENKLEYYDENNYTNTILWNSKEDLMTYDGEVAFTIIPQDNDEGIGDTIFISLDNNELPEVIIANIDDEKCGDIDINYELYDNESDTINISVEYYHEGNWHIATTSGSTQKIVKEQYKNNFTWLSREDLPNNSDYFNFRITPFDNDSGKPDTITILLDNLGVPTITFNTEIHQEVSGNISFDYIINDDEEDVISLVAEYSIDDGISWHGATTSGNLTNIQPDHYIGVIIWLSDSDATGVDTQTALFRLTPSDANKGVTTKSGKFHLDNNDLPEISILSDLDTLSWNEVINFEISDNENDNVRLIPLYKYSTDDYVNPKISNLLETYSAGIYQNSIEWDIFEEFGYNYLDNIELQFLVADNDTNFDAVFTTVIRNYPADFSGDRNVDFDDLPDFAAAWNSDEPEVKYDIGPAEGTLPKIYPQPDGTVYIEDLVVFVQMWNWSFKNDGILGKDVLSKATGNEDEYFIVDQNSNEINWEIGNETLVQVSFQPDLEDVMVVDATMSFNKELISINNIIKGEYWIENFITSQLFRKINSDTSSIRFSLVGFGKNENSINNQEDVFQLNVLNKTFEDQYVDFQYDIYALNGDKISTINQQITIEAGLPKEYKLHDNFPNPFNSQTTIRFELPKDEKVLLNIYNIRGQLIKTITNKKLIAGYHQFKWDGKDNIGREIGSGMYIYQIITTSYNNSKKMVLLK